MGGKGGGWWECLGRKMLATEFGTRLEFHVRWSGWTRPLLKGGRGVAGEEVFCKGCVEGVLRVPNTLRLDSLGECIYIYIILYFFFSYYGNPPKRYPQFDNFGEAPISP